ncbi:B-box zinc finger protein 21, partial [Cucurbita argyrosperma subsp. sororia]
MKILCDVCENAEAVVFCTADEAALCNLCDHRVHNANKLASKHRRFSLLRSDAAEAPVCDVCRERRGLLFCQQDRAILCRECDDPIHSANELTMKHDRFLQIGIKLSATATLYEPPPSGEKLIGSGGCVVSKSKLKGSVKKAAAVSSAPTVCTTSVCVNAPTNLTPTTAVNEGGGGQIATEGGGSASSISEYLMETLPGWPFEEFLEFEGVGFPLSSWEGLEPWVPRGPPAALFGLKDTKALAVNSSKVNRVWTDDGFTVPQIISTTPSAGFKTSRPFS